MAIGHWLKNFTKWYFDPDIEGGGGDSDFHKATITLEVDTAFYAQQYMCSCFLELEGEEGIGGVFIVNDSLWFETVDKIVTNPQKAEQEVEIFKDKYALVFTTNPNEVFTVSGDAELVTVPDSGNAVKVFGDCTISTAGTR